MLLSPFFWLFWLLFCGYLHLISTAGTSARIRPLPAWPFGFALRNFSLPACEQSVSFSTGCTSNIPWNLDADIQKKAREIMNSSQNMVAIPGPIDSSKGIAIREVLEGKTVEPRPDRDQYMALSYTTARHTAEKLDELFKPLFRDNENVTFHSMLHEVMEKAGILEEGQPSPPESDGKESGPSSPARQSSASKESSGKSCVNIRPHSPVASCSKLPSASSKASLENISLKVVRENKEHDEHI
ncbi:hypothetical protein CPC08DRAFT_748160, partial [Agrocybe pediades]